MIQIRLYNNQTSSLYFRWKNCIYSKCDWNPCPALIFQVTHQSFRRNGILHPSYSKTYQLTSVWIIQWAIPYPGLALCTEDKFHQQWTPCFSLESWESSQNNWEILGLLLQSHCTETKAADRSDGCRRRFSLSAAKAWSGQTNLTTRCKLLFQKSRFIWSVS